MALANASEGSEEEILSSRSMMSISDLDNESDISDIESNLSDDDILNDDEIAEAIKSSNLKTLSYKLTDSEEESEDTEAETEYIERGTEFSEETESSEEAFSLRSMILTNNLIELMEEPEPEKDKVDIQRDEEIKEISSDTQQSSGFVFPEESPFIYDETLEKNLNSEYVLETNEKTDMNLSEPLTNYLSLNEDLNNLILENDKKIVIKTIKNDKESVKRNSAIWNFDLSDLNEEFSLYYKQAKEYIEKEKTGQLSYDEKMMADDIKNKLNNYVFNLQIDVVKDWDVPSLTPETDELLDTNNMIFVNFLENGSLPGKVNVNIDVGIETANQEYIVYYVYKDEKTNQVRTRLLKTDLKVDNSGYIRCITNRGIKLLLIPKTEENMANINKINRDLDQSINIDKYIKIEEYVVS